MTASGEINIPDISSLKPSAEKIRSKTPQEMHALVQTVDEVSVKVRRLIDDLRRLRESLLLSWTEPSEKEEALRARKRHIESKYQSIITRIWKRIVAAVQGG
jgi:hypothetical protein